MYEVEVKVPADHGAVRLQLSERGVEPSEAVEQVDAYYDAPHRSFGQTDEALRLRVERPPDGEAVHELTYKGPKVDAESKTREEHETRVADPEAVDATLRALGFAPTASVEKFRERYHLEGYTVSLDDVDGLGQFVEVEAAGEEHEVDELRAGAFDVLAALGLDPGDQVRTSYLGLILEEDA